MKKKFLTCLAVLLLLSTASAIQAKSVTSSELAEAIKAYKSGNYSESYVKLETVIKNDPANALAYYYMAITAAQIGRRSEAIENYDKAIALSPSNNNLSRYAKKGKRCLEEPEKCQETTFESFEAEFIENKKGPKFSDRVFGEHERLKLENFMREMNRNDAIEPQRFKEYKDFSSVPTNDEIVAAIRTLQNAGLGSMVNTNYADLSVLTGAPQQNSMLNMFAGNSSMNPQLIQALLTNNMVQGF